MESKNFVLEKPGIILKFVEPQYLDDCLNNHFWFSSYGYFHKKENDDINDLNEGYDKYMGPVYVSSNLHGKWNLISSNTSVEFKVNNNYGICSFVLLESDKDFRINEELTELNRSINNYKNLLVFSLKKNTLTNLEKLKKEFEKSHKCHPKLIIIKNPNMFEITLIAQSVNQLWWGKINYHSFTESIDKNIVNINFEDEVPVLFKKDNKFSYQNEFRVVTPLKDKS